MKLPVEVINRGGSGEIVILCEHASAHIPREYFELGLCQNDRKSHAAWDPGALDLASSLSQELDAPLIASCVSRLIYDCNRPPEEMSSIPAQSELIHVPGNVRLSSAERHARAQAVYLPFCQTVSNVLDARGADTFVVTVHSFTPTYFGKPRLVELGLLHDSDTRLADAMLINAVRLPHRKIARNEPYGPADGVTHSLKLHAVSRGLANVMIEVRNDLIATENDISEMTRDIVALLEPAITELKKKG